MMMNNFENLADKAITDEELDQVSGGAGFILCAKCGAPMSNVNGAWVCPNCG